MVNRADLIIQRPSKRSLLAQPTTTKAKTKAAAHCGSLFAFSSLALDGMPSSRALLDLFAGHMKLQASMGNKKGGVLLSCLQQHWGTSVPSYHLSCMIARPLHC